MMSTIVKTAERGGGQRVTVGEFQVRALLRRAESMISLPELSDAEFRLMFQLVFRDRGGQSAFASVGTMAAATGKSERSAHRALASLRKKKAEWITVTMHPEYRTKSYRVRFPKDAHLAARKTRQERQGTPLKVAGHPHQERQPTMTNSSYKESESLFQRKREIHYENETAKPEPTPVGPPLRGGPPAPSKADKCPNTTTAVLQGVAKFAGDEFVYEHGTKLDRWLLAIPWSEFQRACGRAATLTRRGDRDTALAGLLVELQRLEQHHDDQREAELRKQRKQQRRKDGGR